MSGGSSGAAATSSGPAPDLASLREEIDRLRAENARLKQVATSSAPAGSVQNGSASQAGATGSGSQAAKPQNGPDPAELARLTSQVEALKASVEILRSSNLRPHLAGADSFYPGVPGLAPAATNAATLNSSSSSAGLLNNSASFLMSPAPGRSMLSLLSPGGPGGLSAAAGLSVASGLVAAGPGAAASFNDPLYGAWGPAPEQTFGQIRLWTGTWNLGAADPFANMEFPRDKTKASTILRPFVPGFADEGQPLPSTPLSSLGLGHFPPSLAAAGGYDVYVLGVQEGTNDKVFEAFAAHTNTYRLPLHCKLYPAKETTSKNAPLAAAESASESGLPTSPLPASKVKSRRLGYAITAQSLLEDKEQYGIEPEPVANTADMLDRVWGRGDGALLTPKFTGIAVFVTRAVAPFVRLLGVYKHSFGASEGSKGGVGVAIGVHDVTMAFVSVHLASKRSDMRRAQYQELTDRLGAKLGGRGFGLSEEFHHCVWLGDTNYHCHNVTAADALAMIGSGRQLELLEAYDQLLDDKEAELAFYGYHEPRMAPSFLPSYKKHTGKGGKISFGAENVSWPSQLYHTSFKEAFYKGGKVVDRVPSWTDRIQYHSLADKSGQLLPELLDPSSPETSAHNYCAVTDAPGLDCSDHSPVYATFTLAVTIPLEECGMRAGGLMSAAMAQGLAAEVERLQHAKGYRNPDSFVGDNDDLVGFAGPATPSRSVSMRSGLTHVADFSTLHPALRPLEVVLSLRHIQVEARRTASSSSSSGGAMQTPRAVSVLFPLPYEDSDRIPDRQKVVRSGSLFSFGGVGSSENRDSMDVSIPCIVSSAGKLENLHLLIKVSLDDGTKAQCVVCLRDGGFVKAGAHVNTFLQPLIHNGLPLKDGAGRPVMVQFELAMHAYERGGFGSPLPPPGYHLLRQQASALGLQGVMLAASSTLGAATGNAAAANGIARGDMVIGTSSSSALHAAGSMMLSPAARLVASQLQLRGLLTEEDTEAVIAGEGERRRNLLAGGSGSNRSLQLVDGTGSSGSSVVGILSSTAQQPQRGVLTPDGRLVLPVRRAAGPSSTPGGAAAAGGLPVRRSSVASGIGGANPVPVVTLDPKARAAALVAATASPQRAINPIQRGGASSSPSAGSMSLGGAAPPLSAAKAHIRPAPPSHHRVPLGPVLGVDGDADYATPSTATTVRVSPSASAIVATHGQ